MAVLMIHYSLQTDYQFDHIALWDAVFNAVLYAVYSTFWQK